MRNLLLSTLFTVSNDLLKNVKLFCVNSEDDHIYFITPSGLHCLKCKTREIQECVNFHEESSFQQIDHNKIISLSYLCEEQTVCLATEDGTLALYNTINDETEIIGSVESGLSAAAWSPDGDIFVVVTGHDTVILMTRDFEPIRESPLFSDEFGENKPVSVGWGKKETQFHGSEGKTAAQLKKENSSIFERDDRKPRISWRGDGQLFAVCAVSPKDECRHVYVFSRDGALQSTSEVLTGMEPELSWRPVGNVIACVQRLPNKYQIVFLEKNGLSRGNFTLPFKPNAFVVRQMLWNSDSSLLAVWVESLVKHNSSTDVISEIQIWTMNNYHWYLKQSLKLPHEKQFEAVEWLSEKNSTLTCITNDGELLQYSWNWTIDRSQNRSDEDETTVVVVDGDKILITPFQKLIVPPPQAAFTITLPCSANQIISPRHHSSNSFAILLADGSIAFLEKKREVSENEQKIKRKHQIIPYNLKGIFSVRQSPSKLSHLPLFLHHWVWLEPNTFLAIHTEGDKSVVLEIGFKEDTEQLIINSATDTDGIVYSLTASSDGCSAIIQFSDCRVLKYAFGENEPKLLHLTNPVDGQFVTGFPQVCHCVQTCTVDGKELIFGSTERLRLYCFDMELSKNCTSFFLHDDFIILTTTDHTLRCIPLKLEVLGCQSVAEIGSNDGTRRVERGSRVVTCIRNGTQVLLQMNRGNLEAIHPRPLILNVVLKSLNQLRYRDAFVLMRKHRINMNLICDHNLPVFLKNVDQFVSQIDNVNWINLFLTDLQEEDVTTSMYCSIYEKLREEKSPVNEKLNQVHAAVRDALVKTNSEKFLLSILTTYVLTKPSDLETALGLVKNLEKTKKDEALNYMKYLQDINDLYNVALGMYDFDLVVMVVQKSQKDPKEYLPFLNELRKMDDNYQRYTIDCHLKRPERALEHIVRCGKERFSECLTHIKDHQLYQQAVRLYEPKTTEYKEICTIYADHLSSKRNYDEAGIWYRRGERYDLALNAFEKALQWQQSLTTSFEFSCSENERVSLACRLAERLKDHQRHLEAAYILENYTNDVVQSIATLIEGHCWDRAVEMVSRSSSSGNVTELLKSSLLEHCKSIMSNMEKTRLIFERHVLRLAVVREEKKKKLDAQQRNCTEMENIMVNDLASEIGSVVSGLTQTTMTTQSNVSRLTSRNRRKQERKKQSLKEGNPFEETALVEALSEITLSADKLKEECAALLRALMWMEYDKEAEELQQKADELFDIVRRSREDIWISSHSLNSNPMGPNSTANSIAASFQRGNAEPISTAELQLWIPPKVRNNIQWKLDSFN